MTEWSSWIQTHPLQAAGLGLIAGVAGLCAGAVLLTPVFTIASANPVLGLLAVSVVAVAGYASVRHRNDGPTTQAPDPVTKLEHQYVNGDITETEFERRLNTLLETDAAVGQLSTDDTAEGQQTEYEVDTT